MPTLNSSLWIALILLVGAVGPLALGSLRPIAPSAHPPQAARYVQAESALDTSHWPASPISLNARRMALVPHTIEAMGQVTEPSTFEYTTSTGEVRVRVIYPMRGCTARPRAAAPNNFREYQAPTRTTLGLCSPTRGADHRA